METGVFILKPEGYYKSLFILVDDGFHSNGFSISGMHLDEYWRDGASDDEIEYVIESTRYFINQHDKALYITRIE